MPYFEAGHCATRRPELNKSSKNSKLRFLKEDFIRSRFETLNIIISFNEITGKKKLNLT
jgi:hypothetical protein